MLERLQWTLDPRRSIVDSRDPQGQIVWVCLKLLELLPADRSEQQEDRADGASRLAAHRSTTVDQLASTGFGRMGPRSPVDGDR